MEKNHLVILILVIIIVISFYLIFLETEAQKERARNKEKLSELRTIVQDLLDENIVTNPFYMNVDYNFDINENKFTYKFTLESLDWVSKHSVLYIIAHNFDCFRYAIGDVCPEDKLTYEEILRRGYEDASKRTDAGFLALSDNKTGEIVNFDATIKPSEEELIDLFKEDLTNILDINYVKFDIELTEEFTTRYNCIRTRTLFSPSNTTIRFNTDRAISNYSFVLPTGDKLSEGYVSDYVDAYEIKGIGDKIVTADISSKVPIIIEVCSE